MYTSTYTKFNAYNYCNTTQVWCNTCILERELVNTVQSIANYKGYSGRHLSQSATAYMKVYVLNRTQRFSKTIL